ncbi:hypothetical protein Droror1_Dr00005424 [Drosera rotundifolia]
MPETDDIQAKPLAPEAADNVYARRRRLKHMKRCGYVTATMILLLFFIILLLALTVFRVKQPQIRLNGVTIQKLDLNLTNIAKPEINVTLVADVSIKNPNAASFRYGNTTTSVSYKGVVVGEVEAPAGLARAMRTARMNLTIDVNGEKLLAAAPNLLTNVVLGGGDLVMDTYTRIGGRVKIMNVVKKHVVVVMNCSVSFDVSSREVKHQQCEQHVSL